MHIHSIASDGTASARPRSSTTSERHTDLDVIAIADHERIEAAVECQRLARERGSRVERRRGRGGHDPQRPSAGPVPAGPPASATSASRPRWPRSTSRAAWRSCRTRSRRSPWACASTRSCASTARTDPLVYWDALEGYNPSTAGRYGRAATTPARRRAGPAARRQQRRPHARHDRRRPDPLPGSTAEDYRRAIIEGTTSGSLRRLGLRPRGPDLRPPGPQAGPRRGALGPPQPPPRRTPRATWACPHDQLAMQRQRESEYLAAARHAATGSATTGIAAKPRSRRREDRPRHALRLPAARAA